MKDKPQSLPKGWVWTKLGEIRLGERKSINPAKTPAQEFELYSVPSFDTGLPEIILGKDIGSSKQIVHESAVLICKINPRINRAWVVGNHSAFHKIASTEWIVFDKVEGIDPFYLCYFMRRGIFRDFLAANVSGVGGSLMRARANVLSDYPFPLAPLPEQRRIVAKIEELFTRLDAGVAALKRVQANLKRYKTSVLKAACEGRLAPQDPNDEPADKLLARILAERDKRKGEASAGKCGSKPARPAADASPKPLDTSELPALPKGWCWTKLESLLIELKNGYFSGTPASEPPGFPILRISAVRPLAVNLNELKYLLGTTEEKVAHYLLKNGDLLFTRYNGNLEFVGACGMVRNVTTSCIYPDKLIRVRVIRDFVEPGYLEFYFATWVPRHIIEFKAKSTAGQQGISGLDLRAIPVSIPPLLEQRRIVAEVERRLSVVQELEQTVNANLVRAERLRQAILKRAFDGRLVPQDPTDEPAEKLLERIKERKDAHLPTPSSALFSSTQEGDGKRLKHEDRRVVLRKKLQKRHRNG